MFRSLTATALAAAGVACCAEPARGQAVFGYQSGFGGGFGYQGPHGGFAFGGFRSATYSSFQSYGPAFGPWGGFYGGPVIVAAPPVVVVQPSAAAFAQSLFPPSADMAAVAAKPPAPAVNRAAFQVVRPQGGAKPPERAIDPRQNLFAPATGAALVPDPGPVPKDPKQAAVYHVSAARTAFAAEAYGRAAECLADAIAADPADPLAYFLLAQVRTARGEYAEAVAAIRDGMKRAPDWPASAFRIREIYAKTPRRFDDHLAELRQAVAANPDDPTLTFLLGYHLWFLHEKADAAKLFQKAVGRVKDGGVIDRFLAEADGKDA